MTSHLKVIYFNEQVHDPTFRRILAIAKVPSAGASGGSIQRFMRYGSASSARLRGRTNASGYCSVSSTSSNATTG